MTTSARELSSRLVDLLRREHHALADFLVALSEFDRARGWVELGYASLFDHLHRALGLSKGAAFYRLTAARLIQDRPEVIEPLKDGRLCLSTVVELAKALEAGGGDKVLSRFFHASKREAKAVVAELLPAASIPTRMVVTAVHAAPAALALGAGVASPPPVHPANQGADLGQSVHLANQLPGGAAPARPPAPVLVEEPLTAELSRVHLTVSRRLMKKIDAARAALSHSHPGASEADVLEVGLDLVLERHAKRRGLVAKPRAPKAKARPTAAPKPASATASPAAPPAPPAEKVAPPAGSGCAGGAPASVSRKRETIPAHVKRAVWLRDEGRCQWKLDGGGICGSTLRVEIDHIVPVALGGQSTTENCELKCRHHNGLAARQVFGDDHMDRFSRDRGGPSPSTAGA